MHIGDARKNKRPKANSLTILEEKALKTFLKPMSNLGNPVRIKFLPSLAFSIARQRFTTNKATKPLGKSWA